MSNRSIRGGLVATIALIALVGCSSGGSASTAPGDSTAAGGAAGSTAASPPAASLAAGTDSPATAAPSAASSVAPSSGASPASVGTAGGGPVDCAKLLTADEVRSVSGASGATSKGATSTAGGVVCIWKTPAGGIIEVTVMTGQLGAAFSAVWAQNSAGGTPVAGVGADAVLMDGTALLVKAGDGGFVVIAGGAGITDPKTVEVGLAKLVLGRV
jgi:hypothetical protein